MTMAMATPAMLPTPTRVPNPIQNASNEDTASCLSPSVTPDNASLDVSRSLNSWNPRNFTVKYRPAPMRRANAMYQTYVLNVPSVSLIISTNVIVSQ